MEIKVWQQWCLALFDGFGPSWIGEPFGNEILIFWMGRTLILMSSYLCHAKSIFCLTFQPNLRIELGIMSSPKFHFRYARIENIRYSIARKCYCWAKKSNTWSTHVQKMIKQVQHLINNVQVLNKQVQLLIEHYNFRSINSTCCLNNPTVDQ